MKLTMKENIIVAMLNDVIYVLDLTKNLFFVSEVTSQGYNVDFGDDNCEIKKN